MVILVQTCLWASPRLHFMYSYFLDFTNEKKKKNSKRLFKDWVTPDYIVYEMKTHSLFSKMAVQISGVWQILSAQATGSKMWGIFYKTKILLYVQQRHLSDCCTGWRALAAHIWLKTFFLQMQLSVNLALGYNVDVIKIQSTFILW